jgi:hypothetical protein
VEAWESFWLTLLAEYEQACDDHYNRSIPLGRYAPTT